MLAPLAALFLVALPGAAAPPKLDPNTGCELRDQAALTAALKQAQDWTASARSRMNDGGESRDALLADMTARDVFGKAYDRKKIIDKLDEISRVLASPDLRCVHKDYSEWHYCDDHGGKTAAWEAFAQRHGAIYLCPRFFALKGDREDLNRVGRLVHEASHVTGVGEPNGESYCIAGFGCSMSCGGDGDPYAVADNWGQFVHCASGHESTEDALEIRVPRPKPGKK